MVLKKAIITDPALLRSDYIIKYHVASVS